MVTLDLKVYPGKLHQNAIYGAKNFTTPELFCQALFSTFFENIFPSQILIETLQLLKRSKKLTVGNLIEALQVLKRFKYTCLNNHNPEVGFKIIHPPD